MQNAIFYFSSHLIIDRPITQFLEDFIFTQTHWNLFYFLICWCFLKDSAITNLIITKPITNKCVTLWIMIFTCFIVFIILYWIFYLILSISWKFLWVIIIRRVKGAVDYDYPVCSNSFCISKWTNIVCWCKQLAVILLMILNLGVNSVTCSNLLW